MADCRAIEGRRWLPDEKVNTFPLESASMVKALCEKHKIAMPLDLQQHEGEYFTDSAARYQVQMEESEIIIRFDYDLHRIEKIKMYVQGASWDKTERCWIVPPKSLIPALTFAITEGLSISPDLVDQAELARAEAEQMKIESASLEGSIDIPGIALQLHPYQQAGVIAMKKRRKVLLADEMGLGKTAQATATVASEGRWPMVVVCKNRLKTNWRRDILKFFPLTRIEVLYGVTSKPIPDCDVIIVNYDICFERLDDIFAHGFQSLVVDESHYIKNGKKKHLCPECGKKIRSNGKNCSECGAKGVTPEEIWTVKRANAVMKLAKSTGPDDFVLLLSGTPIVNRPGELIPQLEAIGQLDNFGGEWKFLRRYAPFKNEAMNTQELNDRLRETCYIRRKRRDVETELPALVNADQYLEIDSKAMAWYNSVEADAVGYFAERARQLALEAGEDGDAAYWEKRLLLERAENLIRITAVRNAVAKIKHDTIVEWIDNFLESSTPDQKVLVFATHIELVDRIHARYGDAAVKIRGQVSKKNAEEAEWRFQNDPTCRIFVGNMESCKEGFTLTEAYNVIFCELDWSPSTHDQCAARCYGRINDMHGATAWYLMAPKTIDEDMYDLLGRKQVTIDAVTDGDGVDSNSQRSVMSDLILRLAKRGMEDG